MTTPTQSNRRISNIRFVSRVEPRRAGRSTAVSPVVGAALLAATAIAVAVLVLTVQAAQAVQIGA